MREQTVSWGDVPMTNFAMEKLLSASGREGEQDALLLSGGLGILEA
jgi:hypothetical protein